ncbi:MAG: hypothetical protein HY716_18420 [Planctomycetes bacterium]|nr:hypothetical protein [Planctomycetota bacterium]
MRSEGRRGGPAHAEGTRPRLRTGVAWIVLGGCLAAAPPHDRAPGSWIEAEFQVQNSQLPAMPSKTSPVLLLHDWFGESPVATPSFIRDHREFLDARPFDGIAVYVRTPDLSLNVTASVLSRKRLTFSEVADALAPLQGMTFKNLTENFAAVVGGEPPDFMDDWTVPNANFAHLARAARKAGLRGIYFDNEAYQTPWTDYPRGVRYPRKSLQEYREAARLRGSGIMRAMVEAFQEITVILLHGPYISEPKAPRSLFPAWQSSNELLGPFFAGFVEGAGKRATVVDGGEIYHLRTQDQFRRSYLWRKKEFPSARVDCAFLPPAIRSIWARRVSIAFGIIDRPFKGNPMNPEVLATTLVNALRRTDRFVWFYVEGPTFLLPPERGGAGKAWVDAIRRARAATAGAPPW